MTNHPQKVRGFAHVTHFVCTAVELEKISTALDDLRSTMSWTTATDYHTSDGRRWCCIH